MNLELKHLAERRIDSDLATAMWDIYFNTFLQGLEGILNKGRRTEINASTYSRPSVTSNL